MLLHCFVILSTCTSIWGLSSAFKRLSDKNIYIFHVLLWKKGCVKICLMPEKSCRVFYMALVFSSFFSGNFLVGWLLELLLFPSPPLVLTTKQKQTLSWQTFAAQECQASIEIVMGLSFGLFFVRPLSP